MKIERALTLRRQLATALDSHRSLSPKVTLQRLGRMKSLGIPIVMLTAHDYPSAVACEDNGVDITLAGDSLAQVCLGLSSTTCLRLTEIIHHCRAVARGSRTPLLVADMPFGSYQTGLHNALSNATRLIQEAGAEAVKVEGGPEIVPVIHHLTSFGIAVMGHIGLMPQRHVSLSGYHVQGASVWSARQLIREARLIQEAGAFAIVLEAIPAQLGSYITAQLGIPTIGIGSGSGTDGQVLVSEDATGSWNGRQPSFVRNFGKLRAARSVAVASYACAVRRKTFPNVSESYSMEGTEWNALALPLSRELDQALRATE